MPDLAISTDVLAELIARTRGLQAREGVSDPDPGSNPSDDNAIDALQDTPGDLTRDEIVSVIRGFDERQKAELVALMWTGRGDAEPEEWEETVTMALERQELPTETYLLSQPLVGELWWEGLTRLGIEVPMAGDID